MIGEVCQKVPGFMKNNVLTFNRFTWFNMGRITKNDRRLIKTIKTENITHKHNIT